MAPRDCSSSNKENQRIASNRQPRRDYVPVANVTIIRSAGSVVTFYARRTDGAQAEHQAPWGDEDFMWAYCPSTLPSSATDASGGNAGPPPGPGAAGTLYLERAFCSARSIERLIGGPKWPDKLPVDNVPSATMQVELIELTLEGIALGGTGRPVTLDLRDTALVLSQTIEVGDGTVAVRLHAAGFQALELPIATSDVVDFAPAHIKLTGIERENGLRANGAVDLMELSMAPRRQAIHLTGTTTPVRLTPRGFAAFCVAFSPDP
jgi:hypothetical protein